MPRVIDAQHARDHRVWLQFCDGLPVKIDLKNELWGPVFEPLKEATEFAKLGADPEADTVDRLKGTLAGRDATE